MKVFVDCKFIELGDVAYITELSDLSEHYAAYSIMLKSNCILTIEAHQDKDAIKKLKDGYKKLVEQWVDSPIETIMVI